MSELVWFAAKRVAVAAGANEWNEISIQRNRLNWAHPN